MKENLKASIEQQKKCESEKLELKSITVDLLSKIDMAVENSIRRMERRNVMKHNMMVFG